MKLLAIMLLLPAVAFAQQPAPSAEEMEGRTQAALAVARVQMEREGKLTEFIARLQRELETAKKEIASCPKPPSSSEK